MHKISESSFTTFDSVELFYRKFLPASFADGADITEEKNAVILFHRGHEHSGRMAKLVQELDLPDVHFFAWDQRGHGRSPGVRGYANNFMDLVRDTDEFIREIVTAHNIKEENIIVIAHSVAAVVISLWVKLYAPRLRGLVLATPAFQVKLYIPFAIASLRLFNLLRTRRELPPLFVKSYVKGNLLTHDRNEAEEYDRDPLISKQIASNILVELADVGKQVVSDAGAITTPVLLLSARADWVVKNLPQRQFFNSLTSHVKEVRVFRDFFHAIFHEQDRAPVIEAVRGFINQAFAAEINRSFLLNADRTGYSSEEYQWMNAGLPYISLKRVNYRIQKLALQTVGKLSDGVRLGWKTGFDSGESLNYVYANTPSGSNSLGRLIDKVYLNSIGWRGIRERKANLKRALFFANDLLLKSDIQPPISIVDIAGGPGRYLLEAIKELSPGSTTTLIRDVNESGLDVGREAANELGVEGIEYRLGDAFSAKSLEQAGERNIAIVSGLYELFPSNELVSRSIAGLAKVVRPGGYLIYTNQPWHPQLEMIAEVLLNREQRPWVMRRRTQAEMDELVREAGFIKIRQWVDNFGIFTVSVAARR